MKLLFVALGVVLLAGQLVQGRSAAPESHEVMSLLAKKTSGSCQDSYLGYMSCGVRMDFLYDCIKDEFCDDYREQCCVCKSDGTVAECEERNLKRILKTLLRPES